MAIVITMCKLFVALVLGFILNKIDILDGHTSKRLSTMIVNFIMPLLIISSVAGVEADGGEVLKLFIAGTAWYLIVPVIGFIVVKLFRVSLNLQGTYMCMVIFSNSAFMGYPVVSAIFGKDGIFYAAIFNMFFNLMMFSLGLYLIRKDAKLDGYNEETSKKKGTQIRQILNNGVIASVIALLVYFTGIQLPDVVNETCSFIGNVCMPLSMMVLGSSIAGYSFKDIFAVKKVYLMTVVRLILLPLLLYGVLTLIWDNADLIKIATVTIGMPIASSVAMAANPYEKQGKEASVAVLVTTLCSMITIPIMCAIL